ncbi:MAG TPA: enoyl-CoA hydratase-related protein [Kofleriaceae bacterium]|nr:enoyl-CoA hydratase-related protein [Kofleriaceae bacterium]
MDYTHITIESQDGLALITIRREQAMNALSSEVLSELTTAAAEMELDDKVSVVALTGAGDKAFVAGADISEMVELGPLEAQALSEMGAQLGHSIETSSKPWIAAVNGFALGGGCELALACDFIYASSNAQLGQPEVKLGVIPGFGGTQRLARRVGVAKAKELIFTGDTVPAGEALRLGLVDLVCEPGELLDKVRATAKRIGRNGPLAVAEAKRLIHVGQSMSLESSILLEERSFGGLFDSEDQKEGMKAFLEKRRPAFHGK